MAVTVDAITVDTHRLKLKRVDIDARCVKLVRRKQVASGGPTHELRTTYTAAGRIDTLTHPSGATIR